MANRSKKIIQTSIIGILTNLGLVAIKAVVGLFAHSISIIMDAINNLSDALSSVITIVGTKLSQKKPDAKHPYGHGRIEYLTSLIISIIILIAGSAAIVESIISIIEGVTPKFETWSFILIAIAVVVKIGLGLYFRFMGKKLNSEALKGSGIDALFDALLSFATLISILVALIWNVNIEGYIGAIIGLFMIKSGIDVLRTSVSSIVGERMSKETSEDTLTAKEIHPLTRKIATQIYQKFGIIMTIGIYATNSSNSEIAKIRNAIQKEVLSHPTIKQMHGFYCDQETKTISFDVIVDFGDKYAPALIKTIHDNIANQFPEYHFYIVEDKDISD